MGVPFGKQDKCTSFKRLLCQLSRALLSLLFKDSISHWYAVLCPLFIFKRFKNKKIIIPKFTVLDFFNHSGFLKNLSEINQTLICVFNSLSVCWRNRLMCVIRSFRSICCLFKMSEGIIKLLSSKISYFFRILSIITS